MQGTLCIIMHALSLMPRGHVITMTPGEFVQELVRVVGLGALRSESESGLSLAIRQLRLELLPCRVRESDWKLYRKLRRTLKRASESE